MSMLSDRIIVCVASDWFYDPTSKHHLMRLLSRRNDVLWINYHASRRPSANAADLGRAMHKLRQVARGPRRALPRLTVLTPLVLPIPGSGWARRINRALLVRQLRSALASLPRRPIQIWSFAPDVAWLRGALGEERFIYYCVDEFSEFAGYDREAIRAAEADILRAADAVVTTSAALFEARRRLHPRTALVPHGVDFDHFAGCDFARVPDDVADLKGPVLGFFGLIAEWVDVELLADVARARPDWTLVLIGDARTDVRSLASRPNVRLLGRRAYETLPGYCARFDAAMVPFHINRLTRAVNPIKLREYLAAGLPVCGTPLPEIERYRGLVEIGEGPVGFAQACERALASHDAESRGRRRAAVAGESWQARLATLSEFLGSTTTPSASSPDGRAAAPAARGGLTATVSAAAQ